MILLLSLLDSLFSQLPSAYAETTVPCEFPLLRCLKGPQGNLSGAHLSGLSSDCCGSQTNKQTNKTKKETPKPPKTKKVSGHTGTVGVIAPMIAVALTSVLLSFCASQSSHDPAGLKSS